MEKSTTTTHQIRIAKGYDIFVEWTEGSSWLTLRRIADTISLERRHLAPLIDALEDCLSNGNH